VAFWTQGSGGWSPARRIPRGPGGGAGDLISIDFTPDAKAINIGLEKWSKLIKDWRPIWRDVERLFLKHEQRQFKTKGLATGPEWAPLSENYKQWKKKHAPGKPLLVFTGTLKEALTKKGGRGQLRLATPRAFAIGIDPTKHYHTGPSKGTRLADVAMGHSRGQAGRLPARPPIRLDPSIHSTSKSEPLPFGVVVAQIAQAHIVEARKKAYRKQGDPFVGKTKKIKPLLRKRTK